MKVTWLTIVALAPLLASCAASGLYNMSDDWCARHSQASVARCPGDQSRVAHNESGHGASDNGDANKDGQRSE